MKTLTERIAALLLTVVATTSCHSSGVGPGARIVQPGAPGASSRVIARDKAVDLSNIGHTEADVRFMQGMIHHHLQALDMTALLAKNTASEDMRKLALRMELSQADEIKMMRRWLEVRGKNAPDDHAHHMPGAPMMPGMLSPEEMDRLAAAKGAKFDRLFLEGMIKHHIGALVMVQELFSVAGAAQDSEIFSFASDVDADQRMDIERMGAMLKELQK